MKKKATVKKKTNPQPSFEFNQRKQEEVLGILLLIMGVFILIALFTYDYHEVPAQIDDFSTVKNGLGMAGVYISHYLIRWTIGYPIFIFPFFVIAWGVNRLFGKSRQQLVRWSIQGAVYALFVSISFALHDAISAIGGKPAFEFSGKIGGWIATLLVLMFGHYGAVVVLIGIVMLSFLLATSITFAELFQGIASFFVNIWLFIQKGIDKAAQYKPKEKLADNKPIVKKVVYEQPQEPVSEPQINVPPPFEPQTSFTSEHLVEEFNDDESFDKPRPQLKLNLDRTPENLDDDPDLEVSESELDFPLNPEKLNEKFYEKPPLELLHKANDEDYSVDEDELRANAHLLEDKLGDFGISSKVVEIHPGPVITRYELEPAPGIKVSRIVNLSDDLAMAMRAKRIRIVAPIPGKAAVGIEIPNQDPQIVYMADIVSTREFQDAKSPLTLALGKSISGKPYMANLAEMPHLLVAGATGSGKSVCLNTIIMSILYKAIPEEVQFLMIDPKRLELSNYAKLYRHHLNYVEGSKQKVATNSKTALEVLKSAVQEMERRYDLLAAAGVRNILEYNQRIRDGHFQPENEEIAKTLEYLVVIVDELADLMLTSGSSKEVEESIARLAQMARAVGIHLIVATQRPSVDVITGVIKANFPARIAFQVASKIDSRTILDKNGAETLLGRGDMLYLPSGSPELIRIHGSYISLDETEHIIEHIRHQKQYERPALRKFKEETEESGQAYGYEGGGKRDPLFEEAMQLVVRHQQGSVSLVQRRLKVGYSRAARIIDELEDAGVVGPFEGSKAREVLISLAELEAMLSDNDSEDDF